ncbi:hypothetical protein MAR_005627 [Mya arenaria]|uniref:Methyltransferase type 11 domain-containing protein n=2 Tax=Mya arenaria TaxID=6604 RepID=A0ABY7F382_MYAAR|nr:hypothetical protein MAR_005627 [Mya arenaria]
MHQQQISKMECEKNSSKGVSTSGGWCQKASYENSGQHKTDLSLAKQLSIFLQDKVVSSFGDGPGRYKQILDSTGLLNGYDAYDGAPFCDTTSKGIVKYLDLTLPQYGIPVYDWIISLEVAEHIPKKFEDTYVDNIVRHAAEGIILSWAVPGQGGYSHVNNRPLKYVEELLFTHGFYRDIQNSSLLQSSSTLPWLKRNINVYRRLQLKNKPDLYAFA